jgi:hypothetical protein
MYQGLYEHPVSPTVSSSYETDLDCPFLCQIRLFGQNQEIERYKQENPNQTVLVLIKLPI